MTMAMMTQKNNGPNLGSSTAYSNNHPRCFRKFHTSTDQEDVNDKDSMEVIEMVTQHISSEKLWCHQNNEEKKMFML